MQKFFLYLGALSLSSIACQTIQPRISETQRLQDFFERSFEQDLARSPQRMSYMSIKTDYDKLDNLDDDYAEEGLAILKSQLAELHSFEFAALDEQSQLSYKLFEKRVDEQFQDFENRHYSYPVNQMFGLQAEFPAFMINIHRIDNESDALAYISRLHAVTKQFAQLREGLEERQRMGIVAPKLVFPKVIDDCRNVITGFPYEKGQKDSVLLDDFQQKVNKLNLSESKRQSLRAKAIEALQEAVLPAYQQLMQLVTDLEKNAPVEVGMWTLPNGLEVYADMLRETTTTHLSADEIHAIGLREVTRIRKEMMVLQKKIGIKGTLQDFFESIRKNPRFYYEQNQSGKEAYLHDNQVLLEAMEKRLPEVFMSLPQDKLQVKPVENYREKSAEVAFYSSPSPDGSRPGVYYVNLFDLRQVPKYKMEALAYHEGVPGHHLQLSISQKLQNLPRFRRFGGYTAYVEGWGLYSEQIPKELGFYKDPYSDLGRLSMEMWRACRLVIDTGIHAKHWSRERSIAYLENNTPADHGEIVKAVERYIVMPSQATAYMIGMLKIMEIRERAQQALGDRFDVRAFHEEILKDGPLPLDLLEEKLATWTSNYEKPQQY